VFSTSAEHPRQLCPPAHNVRENREPLRSPKRVLCPKRERRCLETRHARFINSPITNAPFLCTVCALYCTRSVHLVTHAFHFSLYCALYLVTHAFCIFVMHSFCPFVLYALSGKRNLSLSCVCLVSQSLVLNKYPTSFFFPTAFDPCLRSAS